jgi:hypothetical protein
MANFFSPSFLPVFFWQQPSFIFACLQGQADRSGFPVDSSLLQTVNSICFTKSGRRRNDALCRVPNAGDFARRGQQCSLLIAEREGFSVECRTAA